MRTKVSKVILILSFLFIFNFIANQIVIAENIDLELERSSTDEEVSDNINQSEQDQDKDQLVAKEVDSEDSQDEMTEKNEEKLKESDEHDSYKEEFQVDNQLDQSSEGLAPEKSEEIDGEVINFNKTIIESVPFEQGTKGDHVVKLKKNLTKLGIGNYPLNPSDFYGDSTTKNVMVFQRYYGLDVTGVVDQQTLSTIETNVNSRYQVGQRGDHIVQLKKNLTVLGIGNYPSNPSITYGDSTARNVIRFQQSNGLIENGIADEVTLAKIEDMLILRLGTSGLHVVNLKQNLSKLGIGNYPNNPSDFFGDSTKNNLKRLQTYYGLAATGIADNETLAVINRNVNSDYQIGRKGVHVVELKNNLTTLGIGNYPANPSGTYGDSTARNVIHFQNSFGLTQNGIADEVTLAKIEKLLQSPYRIGQRGSHIVELKQNLTKLGIGNYPSNPSNFYGDSTVNNVRRFQLYYGVHPSGIADDITLNKINDALQSPYQIGQRGSHVVELKKNLTKLGVGNYPSNPSNFYGDSTANNVRALQRYYGLNVNGIADEVTLAKIRETLQSAYQLGKRGQHVVDLKKRLTRIGIGNYPLNPSNFYGDSTVNNVKRFQGAYNLNASGIVDEVTLQKIDEVYRSRVVKIFLDPGHGGRDPGGHGFGVNEKNIVLDVALKTSDYLLRNYSGVDVQLSRVDDTFIELEDRAKLANNWRADYFVSIHTNAWIGKGEGFESFIHTTRVTKEAQVRQKEIHDYLISRIGIVDRGKKQANFSVLRNTNMPALLIEYMFIDNYDENKKLRDRSYRSFLARITAEAIANSFNLPKK